jgi:hypothetical protein
MWTLGTIYIFSVIAVSFCSWKTIFSEVIKLLLLVSIPKPNMILKTASMLFGKHIFGIFEFLQ